MSNKIIKKSTQFINRHILIFLVAVLIASAFTFTQTSSVFAQYGGGDYGSGGFSADNSTDNNSDNDDNTNTDTENGSLANTGEGINPISILVFLVIILTAALLMKRSKSDPTDQDT